MKTKSILLLIFLSLPIWGFSQMAVSSSQATLSWVQRPVDAKYPIDTCFLTVNYRYTYILDTLKKTPYFDLYTLEIGKHYSKFYSLFSDQCDSLMYQFRNSKAARKIDAAVNPRSFLKPYERENQDEYYWDYPSKDSLTVTQPIVNCIYSYKEATPTFKWHFHEDTRTILGYKCQKASTRFRGRDYEVWFTEEIPIAKGPWKFGGLMGLILAVQTQDQHFKFEALSVEVNRRVKPLHGYSLQYREVKRKDLMMLMEKSYEDPAGLVISHGWWYFGTNEAGKSVELESGQKSFPYVPFLELE